jgi:outer membrane protein OmpA-like peptidoglycan-associated protein
MNYRFWITALAIAVLAVGLTGCATTKSVDQKIAAATATTDQKLETVETQVESLQQKQAATDGKLEELSKSAQEALARANEAGLLAKGKVVFEQAFTEDRLRFKLGSDDLDESATTALDEFAAKVKELDRVVYIEIQGHTDGTGGEMFNEELGQRRAEAVRRYLSKTHNVPLGRMSTISYGETSPVDSNKTRAGRTANRRVVIVVLE